MSSDPKVQTLSFRPLWPLLFGLALTGCAANPKAVAINLPSLLKEPCPRAELGPLATAGDVGALVIRQEAAVQVCDARREAVVSIVEGYNTAVRPKRWWQFSKP